VRPSHKDNRRLSILERSTAWPLQDVKSHRVERLEPKGRARLRDCDTFPRVGSICQSVTDRTQQTGKRTADVEALVADTTGMNGQGGEDGR
jgi:hypothetical protein